jgi:hypothetical protein
MRKPKKMKPKKKNRKINPMHKKYRRHIYMPKATIKEVGKRADLMTYGNWSQMVNLLVNVGLRHLREMKGKVIIPVKWIRLK